ncbi:MAG: YkgJ family cysteine cluster protein [Myxococcales bacterium]|nr:YkgJ family cysteine cluster protein [Myxococcales bacterium]MDH5306164.1 YkgJ family cysteine cluster protein [Myxococcales bacterium]MDH5566574.1 YkgJ family cysteine cluster protein [Myxococcales bacterium]
MTAADSRWPFRFRCRRSGNCCARPEGIVRVDAADVERIAAYLGLREETFRTRYVARRGDRLKDAQGSRCVFLEDGGTTSCHIYPVRPKRCRSWPFWDELRDSPDALRDAVRTCPGLEPIAGDEA